jgi:hypothetical protein
LLKGADIENRLDFNLEREKEVLNSLRKYGVAFDDLLVELREGGVASFTESYQQLIAAISESRRA